MSATRVTSADLRGVVTTFPVTLPTDHLTDVGSAERFAAAHGHEVRYDHRRGRWLIWRGHRWAPDTDQAIIRLATAHVRDRQRDALTIADLDRRDRTIKHLLALERRGALDSMLILARAQSPIADAGEQWDSDPWLLGVENGMVDLRTGELRDGKPEDKVTMSTAVPYDPDARCPRWEQTISDVFDGDLELVEFVQRALGYSVTGITAEQVLFICYGIGANGKGTILNTILRVLNDYSYNMPFSTIELHQRSSIPNDLAALISRRLIIASETNDATRLNEARVKALTGCDPITARFLHGEFFTFDPVAKFWLAVNHKPTVRDDSYGFWRRIRLIPFTRIFPVDMTLAGTLAGEAPGILRWLVEGCLAWQRDGLCAPAKVAEATEAYRTDSDPLNDFLREACDLDPEAECRAADLYRAYGAWADQQGLGEHDKDRLRATGFGCRVAERFRRVHSRTGWVYLGLQPRSVTG